jgi:lactoylglutathione lyase
MAKFHRIDHVALHVKDVETSKQFYERHFGFETYFRAPTPTGLDIAYLKLGDTVLELTGHADPARGGFHFCVETDDFDGAVAGLKKAGVPVAQEPHKTAPREPREATWRRVVFKGPDGELVEIRG